MKSYKLKLSEGDSLHLLSIAYFSSKIYKLRDFRYMS
jgi:hypothetical protein